MSRWHRRYLLALLPVALICCFCYFHRDAKNLCVGIRWTSGGSLCGFFWTPHEIGFAAYRRNQTVICGIGASSSNPGISAHFSAADGKVLRYWSSSE
jgi:hypothetical protein